MSGAAAERSGGGIFDAFFFVAIVGLSAALVTIGTIIPNARKAARAEREVARAEAHLDALAGDVERLRLEVTSLRSDPWAIERALKRKAKELRPDLFPAQPLPATVTAEEATER